MTRVTAPVRLHFGLFHVPGEGDSPDALPQRAFGGVGLMIDQPAIVVSVRPSDSWQFEGPLASRAQEFALRFVLSHEGVSSAIVGFGSPAHVDEIARVRLDEPLPADLLPFGG